MSARFTVRLTSAIRNHPLPTKLVLVQRPLEPLDHVLLKLLSFVIFYRERLQIEPQLHDENIPFTPDLIQLDYQLRPALWIECGDTATGKLDKLAVKAPWSDFWIVLGSEIDFKALVNEMSRNALRRDRYNLLLFAEDFIEEMLGMLGPRNELTLFHRSLREPKLQLDFNGIWFDSEFTLSRF